MLDDRPGFLRAQRRRRSRVAGQRGGAGRPGGRGARGRAVLPGTGHLDRRMPSRPRNQGRQRREHRRRRAPTTTARRTATTSTGTPRSTGCSSRRSPRRCSPSARWRGRETYDGHWVAAGSKQVFELARCPAVSNDHDITGERSGYQGITIPKAQRGHRRARRHPGDGRARAQHLPRRAEPVSVPRGDQALGAVRRRDHPGRARREDRVGPDRLRRRPRQRRACGAHPGDDGHRAEEVDRSTASRRTRRCTPPSTRPTPREIARDAPRRWASTCSPT